MAKKDAQPEQNEIEATPEVQTESKELFGHLNDDDKEHAGFTDEELAGMEDEEDSAESEAAEEPEEAQADGEAEAEGEETAEAEQTEETEEQSEEAEQPEGEQEQAEGDGGTKAEAAPEQQETEAEPIDETDPAVQTLLDTRTVLPSEWMLPENARETLTQAAQQLAELRTKFDEGQLSASEFGAQSDALNEKITTLRSDIRDAERAFQRGQQHWEQRTVSRFLRDNPEWKRNDTMLQMLDGEVARLQRQSGDPFDPRHLINAARNLKKAMGVAPQPKAQTEPKPKEEARKPNPVPKGQKPEIPPTLARVPNDQIDDLEGGKFARLDRLYIKDPLAYQDELSKLSAAERDEYLAA